YRSIGGSISSNACIYGSIFGAFSSVMSFFSGNGSISSSISRGVYSAFLTGGGGDGAQLGIFGSIHVFIDGENGDQTCYEDDTGVHNGFRKIAHFRLEPLV